MARAILSSCLPTLQKNNKQNWKPEDSPEQEIHTGSRVPPTDWNWNPRCLCYRVKCKEAQQDPIAAYLLRLFIYWEWRHFTPQCVICQKVLISSSLAQLTSMDRSSRQKVNKETEELKEMGLQRKVSWGDLGSCASVGLPPGEWSWGCCWPNCQQPGKTVGCKAKETKVTLKPTFASLTSSNHKNFQRLVSAAYTNSLLCNSSPQPCKDGTILRNEETQSSSLSQMT